MELNEFKLNEKWVPIYQLQRVSATTVESHTLFSETFGMLEQSGELRVVSLKNGLRELTCSVTSHNDVALVVCYNENEIAIVDKDGLQLINVFTNEEIINIEMNDVFVINGLVDSVCVIGRVDGAIYAVALHYGDWGQPYSTVLREFPNDVKLSEYRGNALVDNKSTPLDNLFTLANINVHFNTANEMFVGKQKVEAIAYVEHGPVAIAYSDGAEFVYGNDVVETDECDVFKLAAALGRRLCARPVANTLSLMATSEGMKIGMVDETTLLADGVPVDGKATLVNEYTPTCAASMRTVTDTAVVDLEQNAYELDEFVFSGLPIARFTPAVVDDDDDLLALVVDADRRAVKNNQALIRCKCALLNVHSGVQQVAAEDYCYFVDKTTLRGRIYGKNSAVLLYKSDVRWALDDKGGWTGKAVVNDQQVAITDYITAFDPDNERFVTDENDARRGTCWTFVLFDADEKVYHNCLPKDTVNAVLFGTVPVALRLTVDNKLMLYPFDTLKDKCVGTVTGDVAWVVGLHNCALVHTDTQTLSVSPTGHVQKLMVDDKLVAAEPFVTPDGELFTVVDNQVTPLTLHDDELLQTAGAKTYDAPANPMVGVMRGENGVYALTATPAHVILLDKLMPRGVC